MLTLYHYPISLHSRRVWVAMLEKQLEFELVKIDLNSSDQLKPEFLSLNPFHHIPVLVDDGFRVIESLAILDYLEAKYPIPSLLPTDAKDLAVVKMVTMVTLNELLPALTTLSQKMLDIGEIESEKVDRAEEQAIKVLTFLESLLDTRPYFGSSNLTLGDITAGTAVSWLPSMGVPLDNYPKVDSWSRLLTQRPSWQNTNPTPEDIEAAKIRLKSVLAQQRQ